MRQGYSILDIPLTTSQLWWFEQKIKRPYRVEKLIPYSDKNKTGVYLILSKEKSDEK